MKLTAEALTSLGYKCKSYDEGGACNDCICSINSIVCETIDCIRGDFAVIDNNGIGIGPIKDFMAVMSHHQ